VYYNCVKFHKNSISSLEGVVLTRYMDGQTGWFLYTPPNFVCGGYNKRSKTCTDALPLKKHILSQNEWRHTYNIIFYLTYTNIQYILREPSWSWAYGSWIYNYLVIQSVSITTNVSLNPTHGEVYSIQHYVLLVYQWLGAGLWFPPPKLTATI
jgi:hypothetical protein